MATPANPQTATRNALRSLGIDLDAYNRLVNHGMGDEDIHLNPLIEEDDDDSDQGLEEHVIDENIMGDDAALIRSLQGLRTLAVHLSKYDDMQQIDDWLDDFDRYTIETGRDTDANKKYDLISHLTGEARQWFTLQSDETKNDYAALRDALKEKFQPTKQEILDTRGQIYAMRQGPTQAFKDFAKQIQLKAKTITMPDAEIVGICINGARPAIKAHIAMAKPASMDELLKLPVVVTEIQDKPQFSISMLKDINDKVDYLAQECIEKPGKTPLLWRQWPQLSKARPTAIVRGPHTARRNQAIQTGTMVQQHTAPWYTEDAIPTHARRTAAARPTITLYVLPLW